MLKTLEEENEETEEGGKVDDNAKMNASSNKDKMNQSSHRQLEFEKHGTTFPLYHYNGLRRHGLGEGGTLTPFRLTRLSAAEAVRASIVLSSKGEGGGAVGQGVDLEMLFKRIGRRAC